MKIEKSVRKAIDEFELGDHESAMLHACNAVDGTAKKVYPTQGSNARFTKLLRDNYGILGPMGLPGIDLVQSRFPVKLDRTKATGGQPDIADVIYGIHRCTHGHGDELPLGFELFDDLRGPSGVTRVEVENGTIRISDRTIFGLVAVAVLVPENKGREIPNNYYLTLTRKEKLIINDWWGRKKDFIKIAEGLQLPSIKLNLGDWHNNSSFKYRLE